MRCGRRGQVQYGSDGLPYCSSCAFFGLNKQCWRCRMYLPSAELQQYRGQWACPYCIQDMRDADRRASERVSKKPAVQRYIIPETCERCGRNLDDRVYILNKKKLCLSCMNEEKKKWDLVGGGPMGAPYKVSVQPEMRRKEESVIESIFGSFLQMLGIKRKTKEIIVVKAKMPISRAKPMAEKLRAKKKKKPRPKSEGLMHIRKTKAKKKGKKDKKQ